MAEHKLTDEQIIESLKICTASGGCEGCCYSFFGCSECVNSLEADALDLIKRQREDIDRLIEINSHNVVSQYEIKAEAIKEFAMRLKNAYTNKRYDKPNAHTLILYLFDKIDNLVKEMTRRCPNCKHFVGCETACGGVPCDGYTEGDTNG